MTYVDAAVWPYGRMMMCHLLADSLEELHDMAAAVGVARKWVQDKPGSAPHYDLCKSKRALAVARGAQEIDRKKTCAIMEAWRIRRLVAQVENVSLQPGMGRDEAVLRRCVCGALEAAGVRFEEEVIHSPGSRTDIYVRRMRVAIELKISTDAAKIYRQCQRYLAEGDIDHVIVVAARRIDATAFESNERITVVQLWGRLVV